MSCISSDELNFLVFRYLQESGFTHAAFALGYEAGINKSPIDGHKVPLGALIKLVQKGLQYIELEANSDADVDDEFTPIEPIDIITMSVDELRGKIKEQKRAVLEEHDKDMETDKETAVVNGIDRGCERDKEADDKGKARERGKEKVEQDKEKEKVIEKEKNVEEHPEKEFPSEYEDRMITSHDENGASGGPEPMEIANETCEVSSSDVIILEGHTSEVFACAWSPTDSILASGSGDSTARIWSIPCGPSSPLSHTSSVVLKHFKGRTNEKSKDVTTLDWNGDGTLLATGSYDGHARIWGRDGELKNTLSKHKGPIFSLKWNKKGDFLLSGSVDKTAIVWDIKTGECKQQFEFHSAPTLDVDWRNNTSFASCSTDSMIYVCKIGESRPTKAFSGHQGEVNAIKWDPTGSLLASCSDDKTAKIWSLKQDKYVLDFKEHEKEIYTIRWSPTGPGTSNANKQLVLARNVLVYYVLPGKCASFDSTIKLWNVDQGRLLYSLNGHRQPVYSVAFSPSGDYLASGSLDQSLHIWSIRDGRIVRTFHGGGGIFEVCWNREGDKLAACFSNNTVCVVDFRM